MIGCPARTTTFGPMNTGEPSCSKVADSLPTYRSGSLAMNVLLRYRHDVRRGPATGQGRGYLPPAVAEPVQQRLQFVQLVVAVDAVVFDEQGGLRSGQRLPQAAQRVQVRAFHVQLDQVRRDIGEHRVQRA